MKTRSEAAGSAVKDLDYYLGLPYHFRVYPDVASDGPYWATEIEELQGCAGDGRNEAEAIQSARDHMRTWLAAALERGIPIPEPGAEPEYSGKFMVRVAKGMHRDLARRAEREGVSLNAWINIVLARHGG